MLRRIVAGAHDVLWVVLRAKDVGVALHLDFHAGIGHGLARRVDDAHHDVGLAMPLDPFGRGATPGRRGFAPFIGCCRERQLVRRHAPEAEHLQTADLDRPRAGVADAQGKAATARRHAAPRGHGVIEALPGWPGGHRRGVQERGRPFGRVVVQPKTNDRLAARRRVSDPARPEADEQRFVRIDSLAGIQR